MLHLTTHKIRETREGFLINGKLYVSLSRAESMAANRVIGQNAYRKRASLFRKKISEISALLHKKKPELAKETADEILKDYPLLKEEAVIYHD